MCTHRKIVFNSINLFFPFFFSFDCIDPAGFLISRVPDAGYVSRTRFWYLLGTSR
eukprot:SAG11_NODE_41257_length_196_cov_28.350515_1_plen_54_part_01